MHNGSSLGEETLYVVCPQTVGKRTSHGGSDSLVPNANYPPQLTVGRRPLGGGGGGAQEGGCRRGQGGRGREGR